MSPFAGIGPLRCQNAPSLSSMGNMEMRGGAWTSQTKADDARDIVRLAKKIIERTDDPQVKELAEKIKRKASDIETY